jgi:inner membrane protein
MFIFAHVGFTLGAAALVSGALTKWGRPDIPDHNSSDSPSTLEKRSLSDRSGLKSLSRFLDIRLLIIGSLMPDIIDKPLAFFGFGGGRSITHTLLVFLIVSSIALYFYLKQKRTWLLAIAIGMVTHLVLDLIWEAPRVLFWPLFGWAFPAPAHSLGLSQIAIWWNTLLTDPGSDITEAIGLLIILVLTWIILNQKNLKSFLLKGRIK